jgi:hypothetical protein
MRLSGLLRAFMGAAARRPLLVGLAVGLLALAGGVLALRLQPTAATPVGAEAGFAATERLHQRFGDEAVYVLVRAGPAHAIDILRVQAQELHLLQAPGRDAASEVGRRAWRPDPRRSSSARDLPQRAVGQIGPFKAESTAQAVGGAHRGPGHAAQPRAPQVRRYGDRPSVVEAGSRRPDRRR